VPYSVLGAVVVGTAGVGYSRRQTFGDACTVDGALVCAEGLLETLPEGLPPPPPPPPPGLASETCPKSRIAASTATKRASSTGARALES
jgi:hypothetical protein